MGDIVDQINRISNNVRNPYTPRLSLKKSSFPLKKRYLRKRRLEQTGPHRNKEARVQGSRLTGNSQNINRQPNGKIVRFKTSAGKEIAFRSNGKREKTQITKTKSPRTSKVTKLNKIPKKTPKHVPKKAKNVQEETRTKENNEQKEFKQGLREGEDETSAEAIERTADNQEPELHAKDLGAEGLLESESQ